MKKIILILSLLLIISLFIGLGNVYAETASEMEEIITAMEGTSGLAEGSESSSLMETINNVIGLLQVTGTGISLIVVTMLGIKYMIASPSEKADTKKQIMPILIGCILLFGAVNIVAAMTTLIGVLDT